MAPSERWIFDTGIYISATRGSAGAVEMLEAVLPGTYLSSVVAAELRAGAVTARARRAVQRFEAWARRVGRVVAPTPATWDRAGDAMARLRQRVPAVRSKVRGLWNDLLIGLSARQIGAIVVTHNAADFTMLQRYAGFLLRVVPEDF